MGAHTEMYYSCIGILTLILHFIINHEVIKKRKEPAPEATIRYRRYLLVLTLYYYSDILWGFLHDTHITALVYADTFIYFVSMALSVLMWARYVISYLKGKGIRSRLLLYGVWGYLGYVIISLIVNFFQPVLFSFDNGIYSPGPARYFTFGLQFLLFLILTVYSLIISIKANDADRTHYRTVSASDTAMATFTCLQVIYPLLPFYALGSLISSSLIHVYVEEDEKIERDREIQNALRQAEREQKKTEKARREREEYNNIAESLAENYDAIYYIEIETGKYREFSTSQLYDSMNVPKYCEDFYKETRDNVRLFVHPDDRDFAEGLYYKDVMLENLKGRRSFSYKYRIMIDGQPRFFRFTVMMTQDKKHFVVCDKDIDDEIMVENERRESQKKYATFSQIAESLASNYDIIYYVNIESSNYIGYTSRNIYGQLSVDRSGDDFFGALGKNLPKLVHPQDCDRLLETVSKDNLLSTLEDKKQFDFEYRLVINDSVQHVRMSIRRSNDKEHFIIGVENIEDEVKKEKEHLKALNTEKELARRDDLTGTKNKTAFSELEQSVRQNIANGTDYLPFAIAVCDMNDLKRVNDIKGHKAGDEYIRSAAKLLCDVFDHSPVFRIGGDEFVIFLRGEDYVNREDLVSHLRETIMANMIDQSGPVIAIGMSEYRQGEDSGISEVFERADNRMYEDKKQLKSGRL